MAKLYLQRHLKSFHNEEKRFSGWSDIPIMPGQDEHIVKIANEISKLEIDKIFSSPLYRNMQTTALILEKMGQYPFFKHLDAGKMKDWGYFMDKSEQCREVWISENFNERCYGDLQGLEHQKMREKFGNEQVLEWRRSYATRPPNGESLKDTFKRTVPFYKKYIEKELKENKNVLIVSSGNALRSIVKYIENISDEKIIEFEIPFGALVKYEFDGSKYKKLQ
jgi:2,3-bisphosphoglycerate-dependent phosphoglycerate mutase